MLSLYPTYIKESYNNGTMTDFIPTDEDLEKGFASLPVVE
jgi:tryptophan synthase beta chain